MSGASRPPPLVLVPACQRTQAGHAVHSVGEKYTEAVRLAGALPLLVPPLHADELDALLALADGVLLTGSPSNVDPRHYDAPVHDARLPLDRARDGWTLPLVPRVLERGVPLLAICRGLQEMNVALGGSLHQALHEQPGHLDHRDDASDPLERQYGPAHPVRIAPGGLLARLLDAGEVTVNSLHGQGIDRLADGLRIEATAPDGVIEAVSRPGAPAFNLGVQWHPEWRAADDPVSMRLLGAFGAACRARRDARHDRNG